MYFCETSECGNRSVIAVVENSQFLEVPVTSNAPRFYSVAACFNENVCGELSPPVSGSISSPTISADLLGFDIPDLSLIHI